MHSPPRGELCSDSLLGGLAGAVEVLQDRQRAVVQLFGSPLTAQLQLGVDELLEDSDPVDITIGLVGYGAGMAISVLGNWPTGPVIVWMLAAAALAAALTRRMA